MDKQFEAANAALDSIRDTFRHVNRARLMAGLARDTERHERATALLDKLRAAEVEALALCLHDMSRAPVTS